MSILNRGLDDRDREPALYAESVKAEDCAELPTEFSFVDGPGEPPPVDDPPAQEPAPVTPPRRNRPGFLWVATNPWAAIDHLGRPAGACPAEVGPNGENARSYVGARPVFGDVIRQAPKRAEFYQRTERRDLAWEFQREPFEVPNTPYYRRKVREHELLDATKDHEAARALLSARHKDAAPPRWI